MPISYETGKVYVIHNTVNDKKYVGSTTRTLAQRMVQHRCYYNKGTKKNYPLYKAMGELGVDKFYIELFKDAPCERKEQLHKAEGEVIRELKTFAPDGYNATIPGRTDQEYRDEHKEKMATYNKNYTEANRDAMSERSKAYYEANRDALKAKASAYYEANREAIALRQKAYHERKKQESQRS